MKMNVLNEMHKMKKEKQMKNLLKCVSLIFNETQNEMQCKEILQMKCNCKKY